MRFSAVRSSGSSAALPTALVALLLVSGTDAYRSTAQCLKSLSRELADAAACGHDGSINYCLRNLPEAAYDAPKSAALSHLEDCFVNAGCTDAEARIEAVWSLKRCQSPGELRVRAGRGGDDEEDDGDGDEEETQTRHRATKTTERQRQKTSETTSEKEKTKEKTTEKTTAPETTATPEPESTAASTAAPSTPTTDPTTSASAAQNTSPQEAILSGRPTQCLATSMVDISVCPTQSTGANSGSKLSCFPTKIAASACSPGLICATSTNGNTSCMFAHNSLDAGGVFVALFFAAAVAASIFFMIFFCCRERREQRKLAKAAEAAAIAREAKKGKAPAVSVSVSAVPPLPSTGSSPAPSINAGRPLYEQDVAGAPQQSYGLPAGYHDPFADQHNVDLHQMR